MTIKQEDYRYDKEEDRANDIKLHDNMNHEGKHSIEKKESLVDDESEEFLMVRENYDKWKTGSWCFVNYELGRLVIPELGISF
jgi:hypothetical protein